MGVRADSSKSSVMAAELSEFISACTAGAMQLKALFARSGMSADALGAPLQGPRR